MELAIRIQVEELPEGLFLATSDELPGLVAQGRTVAEALSQPLEEDALVQGVLVQDEQPFRRLHDQVGVVDLDGLEGFR